MKLNTIVMALILASMSLAGCVSQPDGTVEVTLTDEQIDLINNQSTEVNHNSTGFSQEEYFVVDYRFNKSDLTNTPAPPPVVHINNSFTVDLNGTSWETGNNSTPASGEITLPCSGYYIVGQNLGTGDTYWISVGNYYYEWTMLYNQTVADIYQDNAWHTNVRILCDENYNTNGSATDSTEIMTILDITIPAGKGLMCEHPGIIKMLDNETNTYGTAYGEIYATSSWMNPPETRYSTSLTYQFDTFTSGISCTAMTLGSGSVETTFSITTQDRQLDYDEEYRIYLVYTLVDVEDHLI